MNKFFGESSFNSESLCRSFKCFRIDFSILGKAGSCCLTKNIGLSFHYFIFFPLSSECTVFSGLRFPRSVHEYSLDHILSLPCRLDIHLRHLQKSYPLQLCPSIIFLVSFRLSWRGCLQRFLCDLKMVSSTVLNQ